MELMLIHNEMRKIYVYGSASFEKCIMCNQVPCQDLEHSIRREFSLCPLLLEAAGPTLHLHGECRLLPAPCRWSHTGWPHRLLCVRCSLLTAAEAYPVAEMHRNVLSVLRFRDI